jgi:hypothetical protein
MRIQRIDNLTASLKGETIRTRESVREQQQKQQQQNQQQQHE